MRVFSAAVLAITGLCAACGSTTVDTPTAPSSAPAPAPPQQYPSLIGEWRARGTVTFTDQATGMATTHQCRGSFGVREQNGGAFSGSAGLTGNGAQSDRYCNSFNSFTGEVTTDGTVTSFHLEVEAYQCTHVSGDGTLKGSASTAGPIQLEGRDFWRCPVPLGQPFDAERTISLQLERG